MADFFETMFAAEVARDIYPAGTLYPDQQRIRMRIGGQTVLIAPAHPNDATGAAPTFPYFGLEHMGLTVDNVDAACEELKSKRRRRRYRPFDPQPRPTPRLRPRSRRHHGRIGPAVGKQAARSRCSSLFP